MKNSEMPSSLIFFSPDAEMYQVQFFGIGPDLASSNLTYGSVSQTYKQVQAWGVV